MKNHLGKLNFTYFLCFQHRRLRLQLRLQLQWQQHHIPHIALALGLKLFLPTSLSLTAAAAAAAAAIATAAATANMSNVMFSVEFSVSKRGVEREADGLLLVFALAGVRQSVNALYNKFPQLSIWKILRDLLKVNQLQAP